MLEHIRSIRWIVLVTILSIGVIRCSEDNSPTAPKIPDQLRDFTVEAATSEEFKAYKGYELFQVNIPIAGDYRLQYTSFLGTYEIIFRLTEPSLLTAVLQEGDAVYELLLQKGTITDSSTKTSQSVRIYEDKGFEADPMFGTLPLIKGGEIFVPTPTPTPIPTYPVPTPVLSSSTPTATDPTIIVAVGDSITYGKGSGQGGYPAMLERKLRNAGYNVIVRNEGDPGERAFATDLTFYSSIDGADIALIMTGTNDVINYYNCPPPDFCNASEHIRSMVTKAWNSGVTPLVSTIIPIKSDSSSSWANVHVQSLNSQILAGVGATIVDNYSAILYYGGDVLFADGLHLNDQGYDIMSWEWYKAIVSNNLVRKK
jgi:lysophospholipase L1-like esterase